MKNLLLIAIIFYGLFTTVHLVCAQTWTQAYAAVNGFSSVASSADGTRLVAVPSGGPIYFSTNSGVAWTSNSVSGVFFAISVASSADGTKLAALALSGIPGTTLYTSTNAGMDWMSNSVPSRNLIAVASSADGNKLVAVVGATPSIALESVTSGPIFTSTNSGTTWQPSGASNEIWSCIASSADGTTLAAGTITYNSQLGAGPLYVSTNSGATWLPTSAPTDVWASVACSADGTRLIAAGRAIYTSINSGTTWITNNVPPSLWTSVASSVDGSKTCGSQAKPFRFTPQQIQEPHGCQTTRPITFGGPGVASSADGSQTCGIRWILRDKFRYIHFIFLPVAAIEYHHSDGQRSGFPGLCLRQTSYCNKAPT